MTPPRTLIGWGALAIIGAAGLALYGLVRFATHLDSRRVRKATAGKQRKWTPESSRWRP